MKPPKGQQSSRCVLAVALLKAPFARKMDIKDDEAEDPEKLEKQPKQTPEGEGRGQNLETQSPLLTQEAKTNGPGTSFKVEQQIESQHNAGSSLKGESPQPSPSIPQDDANVRSSSEEPQNTSHKGSRESRPRVSIKDIGEGSRGSLISSTGSKSISRNSKSSKPLSPNESIEGEFERGQPENMGPTLGQYRYQMTREDYEALSKSLQEKTITTLIHLGEIHKAAYVDSQPPTMRAPVAPRLSQETTEARLFILEKEMKLILRRIKESKREQAHTLQQINDLEVKMFKRQGAEYIRDIMSKVPNQDDLKDMQQIRQLMIERKRLQKEIEKLNMEMSSMNKAMANADVIISECAAIKKPRKVVICPRVQNPLAREESNSREVIGRESPARNHLNSPPTTDSIDSPQSSSMIVEPDGPGDRSKVPPEPSEQPNAPENTGSDREINVETENKTNGK